MTTRHYHCKHLSALCLIVSVLASAATARAGDVPTGACCFQGTCSDITEGFCNATNGTYLGDFTTCQENPDACIPGSCCLPSGCMQVAQVDCGLMGGNAFVQLGTCGEGTCGACCLPEGGGCVVTGQIDCLTTDGAVYNPDQLCEGEICGPLPTGACCQESGCVENVNEPDCLAASGIWAGVGTDCTSNETICDVGECCLGTDCVNDIEINCTGQGGIFTAGVFCGGESCPEPIGACCGETNCVETTEAICQMGQDREFLGAGTTCDPDCFTPPDPTGACCLPESDCADDTSAADCNSSGGTYLGDESICEGNPGCDTGACCRGNNCSIDTSLGCAGAGGDFLGAGTTCMPDPCGGGPVTGACCRASGMCEDAVVDIDCMNAGDTFLGEGSTCVAGTCDIGVCCSASAGCQQISESQCLALGDSVFISGATCAESPCAPGACCAGADGTTCVDNIDPWNCTSANGRTFVGAGTTCESDPCAPSCLSCPGDTNGDGQVDGADIQSMVACLIAAGGGAPAPDCGCGDMNEDELLNGADIALVANAYLNATGPCGG